MTFRFDLTQVNDGWCLFRGGYLRFKGLVDGYVGVKVGREN